MHTLEDFITLVPFSYYYYYYYYIRHIVLNVLIHPLSRTLYKTTPVIYHVANHFYVRCNCCRNRSVYIVFGHFIVFKYDCTVVLNHFFATTNNLIKAINYILKKYSIILFHIQISYKWENLKIV